MKCAASTFNHWLSADTVGVSKEGVITDSYKSPNKAAGIACGGSVCAMTFPQF